MGGISNPAVSSSVVMVETEVFSGTCPTTWTDLDLSAVVGSKSVKVSLKCYSKSSPMVVAFRRNGDTDELHNSFGSNAGTTTYERWCIYECFTDPNGVVEWKTGGAVGGVTVDVVGYMK